MNWRTWYKFINLTVFSLVFGIQTGFAANFKGAVPNPVDEAEVGTRQLLITFPKTMIASENAFSVDCAPQVKGAQSWAISNTIWKFDVVDEDQYNYNGLTGGSRCEVKQTSELKSTDGTVWAAGSIKYEVVVNGPNPKGYIVSSPGVEGLRETDPVILIQFDGEVDRDKFFSKGAAWLTYAAGSGPQEKMTLSTLSQAEYDSVLAIYKQDYSWIFSEEDGKEKQNYVIATLASRTLISSAAVVLNVKGAPSLYNSSVASKELFTREFKVRGPFRAEVNCVTEDGRVFCTPESSLSVSFNSQVKWSDVKNVYLEYSPYSADKGVKEKAYPSEAGAMQAFAAQLADFDSLVSGAAVPEIYISSLEFVFNVEPQTQGRLYFPADLKDYDGRALASPSELDIDFGAKEEAIRLPGQLVFFEKEVEAPAMPISVMDQNQEITLTQTGAVAGKWAPVRDFKEIVRLLRAYEALDSFRETPNYESPLDKNARQATKIKLSGQKNRLSTLQLPFAGDAQGDLSGLYVLEVFSPTLHGKSVDLEDPRYRNPAYTMAHVSDLSVHVKRGQDQSIVWVTSLSTGKPVGGVQVEIYNCLGELKTSAVANSDGIAKVKEAKPWADSCDEDGAYGDYFDINGFFAVARSGKDFSFTHSGWVSSNSYAYSSTGVEYVYSNVQEGQPLYHGVIGINLVKPGQKVPVQILARMPLDKGFGPVDAKSLPTRAVVQNNDDEDVFFEFPLKWSGDSAQFVWNVPAAAKLGSYSVVLKTKEADDYGTSLQTGIDVAEFKVPVMSGSLQLPKGPLVKPDSLPANGFIKYANGSGARDQKVSLGFYLAPAGLSFAKYEGFSFGAGEFQLADKTEEKLNLPTFNKPALVENLTTNSDGAVSYDLNSYLMEPGKSVKDVMAGSNRPYSMIVRMRYQDQTGEFQTLSASETVYNAEKYVGVKIISGEVGKSAIEMVTLDTKGESHTDNTDLVLKLKKIKTTVMGEKIFGGLIKSVIDRQVSAVSFNGSCTVQEKIIRCSPGTLSAGSYAVEVESKSLKQSTHAQFKVDANGKLFDPRSYYDFGDEDEAGKLPLSLNQESYKGGEQAKVSFTSPSKECSALVTLERNNVTEAFVDTLACEKGSVSVNVDAASAPNTFVSVLAVSGRVGQPTVTELDLGKPSARLGFANIKINWESYALDVQVKTEKSEYGPRDTVKGVVAVAPKLGTLSQPTVTVIAIEEKILELFPNDSFAILEAMMGMRSHNVMYSASIDRIKSPTELRKMARAESAPANGRKDGEEGGSGSEFEGFRRQLFDSLVYWQAEVPVVNGKADFSFTANDALTKFRVIAVASDGFQKYGSGFTQYLSSKTVQTFANIAAVATDGDRFPLKVNLQNNSPDKNYTQFKVQVTYEVLDADGKVMEQKTLEQSADVASGASSAVSLGDITVPDGAASVRYEVTVRDGQGQVVDQLTPDAQQVVPAVPLSVQEEYFAQVPKGVRSFDFVKRENALPGKGRIRSALSNSLVTTALADMQESLRQNEFANLFIDSKLLKALINSSEKSNDELKAALNELVSQVDQYGFIKYYAKAERGNFWLTADFLQLLQSEPWAKDLVPSSLSAKWSRGFKAVLEKEIAADYIGPADDKGAWFRAQTKAVLVSLQLGDEELKEVALEKAAALLVQASKSAENFGIPLEKWSNDALIDVLALTQATAPAKMAKSQVKKILLGPSRLVINANSAVLADSKGMGWWGYSDEILETSKLVNVLAQEASAKPDSKPSDDYLENLVRGMVDAKLSKRWYTARTQAWVLAGLKSFSAAFESEKVSGDTEVKFAFSGISAVVDWSQVHKSGLESPWTEEKETVAVAHTGGGAPWVSLVSQSAVPLKSPRSQGFIISKKITNKTREVGYQIGDLIEVELSVETNAQASHVALMDPIPSGANILGDAWGYVSSSEKSYRGYKMYFYYLPSGKTSVKYQYQLNNPGVLKMAPTKVEALYEPARFGETPNATLTVQ